jgi:pimeloyl-ACP methyl ester carboxylesterase
MGSHRLDTTVRFFALPKLTRRQAMVRGGAGLTAGLLAVRGQRGVGLSRTAGAESPDGEQAGLVDIGGRSLYMESHGASEPTVVLEAGQLARSDVWNRDLKEQPGVRAMVLPAIAALTRVVAYDRPGTIGEVNPDLTPDAPLFLPSRSDPVPQPRTVRGMVEDLHALLHRAGIPGPYILAGHSMGGLCMRLFASTYPDEVAGMVLVDATHEDVWTAFEQALAPDAWAEFEAMSVENRELSEVYPEYERISTAPLIRDPNMAVMRRAREESPLRPMPLAVLAHGLPFPAPFPEWPVDEMEGIMRSLQDDLAQLVPDARYVIAEASGHNIHQDQPELVIEAIRWVLDAVRSADR